MDHEREPAVVDAAQKQTSSPYIRVLLSSLHTYEDSIPFFV